MIAARVRVTAVLCVLSVWMLAACAAGAPISDVSGKPFPHPKKLIEYGWDTPDPAFIRQHIREMEQRPFDGIIFHLPGYPEHSSVFTRKMWDKAKLAGALEDCRNIQWQKFTDNFLVILSASDMDWFSDADWQAVLQHVRIIANAAALARCRGVCFDPEPYGTNPWRYSTQPHAREKSFDAYQAMVRGRGAQFMGAIQQFLPHPVVHTFFLLSDMMDVAANPDPARRNEALSRSDYALLPAFFNGMLDAAAPGAVITDGNEDSYYYASTLAFFRSYYLMRQFALSLVAPENVAKYETQVQVSEALYVDYLFALGRYGNKDKTPATDLTPEERQKWALHNTLYGLAVTDEYVWLYSENMNWWTNKDIPAGLEDSVRTARADVANRQPPGFDIADVIRDARQRKTNNH